MIPEQSASNRLTETFPPHGFEDWKSPSPNCVFCDYKGPSKVLCEWGVERRYFAIEPLNPVTTGHVLVIPRDHHERLDPNWLNDELLWWATWWTEGRRIPSYNLILSIGAPATQTIKHVHMHIIPRREGDGLALPWTRS